MKKTLIIIGTLLVLTLGISTASFASIGVGFGWSPTISNMTFDVQDGEPDTLFQFKGLGFTFPLDIYFSGKSGLGIGTGLTIITKGCGYDFDDDDYSGGMSYQYVQIPMFFKFKLDIGLYFAAGLGLEFNFAAETWTETDDASVEIDIDDETSLFNLAVGFKLGFDFEIIENLALFAEFGFEYGVLNMYDGDYSDDNILNSISIIFPVIGVKYFI